MKDTIAFLTGLEKNNNKAWFEAHRADYEQHWVGVGKELVELIGPKLRKIDATAHAEPRINGSIMRINRDIRFSKDKSPYKPHLDLWFWTGAARDGTTPGYFVRITPRELMMGAGMHHFEPDMLKKYRAAVNDPKKGAALAKLVTSAKRKGLEVGNVGFKKVPRGFDADHARAELLKHDSLHAFTTRPVPTRATGEVMRAALDTFKRGAPIANWLALNLR